MSDTIISVEGLGKKYVLSHQGERGGYSRFSEKLEGWIKKPFAALAGSGKREVERGFPPASCPLPLSATREEFWALKDVSFEVKRGEVVGIIGRNGAGKSTLLKILSRITEPTEGRVTLRGRVASLLEVGTGFHPELTGRENIFLNGAILGMTKAEIRKKFDEIVAFAEVERFLDTPVKRYSSGMYVRLAFAVAAHLEPEILVVDEVLAVGDAEFQKKCLGKMKDVATGGRTVLFVSHNMAAIQNLCPRVLLLRDGKIGLDAESQDAVAEYIKAVNETLKNKKLENRKDRSGTKQIIFSGFKIENIKGDDIEYATSGSDIILKFFYKKQTKKVLKKVSFGFSFNSNENQILSVLYSDYVGSTFEISKDSGFVTCKIKNLPLAPNKYFIGGRIMIQDEEADWPNDAIGEIEVKAGDFYKTGSLGFEGRSIFKLSGKWEQN